MKIIGKSITTGSTKVFNFTKDQLSNTHKTHPAWIFSHASPRFNETYCSQCGKEFGPGDCGYSQCSDHDKNMSKIFNIIALKRNGLEKILFAGTEEESWQEYFNTHNANADGFYLNMRVVEVTQ